jgi:hypothetical protein
LGEIPHNIIIALGRKIVHSVALGKKDLGGDDFADILAATVGGRHRRKPLGIADVELERCAWSVKTVKSTHPFSQTSVRLISGRNDPKFSQGIQSPLEDIQKTGRAVLEIWNERVNEAYAAFDDLRIFLLVRNMENLEFLLTEHEAHRFHPSEFRWELNSRKNLEGFHRSSGEHAFTWQPGGAQFTVLQNIPITAQRFKITRRPDLFAEEEAILKAVGFDETWIETVTPPPES